jgi:periplasmic copper chaperone A
MKIALKIIAAHACFAFATAVFAHVVLDEPVALAGVNYRAALRVSHGCEGSPTIGITVRIPPSLQGAKPQPKPGWVLTVEGGEITWTAASREYALPDAFFDEFVLRGGLPKDAQPLWFKVLQTCENGRNDWTQIPAQGTSTKGLKFPAALLELIPSGPAEQGGHQH